MDKIFLIRTTRLILRPLSLDDAASVRELAGERDVAATTLNIPHPYALEQAVEWISRLEGREIGGEEIVRAITSGHDGQLLGVIGLMPQMAHHRAEIG